MHFDIMRTDVISRCLVLFRDWMSEIIADFFSDFVCFGVDAFGISKFIIRNIFKIKQIKYALWYPVICPLWSRLLLFSCSQHQENRNFMLQITLTEQNLYHGLYSNTVDNVKICRVECWVINQKWIAEEGVYVNWVDPKWNRGQRNSLSRMNREYKQKQDGNN